MKYYSYKDEVSIEEGSDAGTVLPGFHSVPKHGELLVTVANTKDGVVGHVVKYTHRIPNYIARRIFVNKSNSPSSKHDGLSGIPIKTFTISNVNLKFVHGGKVRNEDKFIIDAAVEGVI